MIEMERVVRLRKQLNNYGVSKDFYRYVVGIPNECVRALGWDGKDVVNLRLIGVGVSSVTVGSDDVVGDGSTDDTCTKAVLLYV